MSFLKKLFGGSSKSEKSAAGPAAEIEHEGYRIVATPMPEGSDFRICGVISKEIGGDVKEHRFIRADLLPSLEAANEMTIVKAKQIIKEQGERLFD